MWDFAIWYVFELNRVLNSLYCIVAKNMILKRFGDNKSRSTFHVRFCSMIRFQTKSAVLNSLHSVLAENMILKRFGTMKTRSTFHVRFCSMIASLGKSRVSNSRHSVVGETMILKRFGANKSRSTCHVGFCSMILLYLLWHITQLGILMWYKVRLLPSFWS